MSLYVSLTTIPPRIERLPQTIASLTTNQTRKPDQVFVALPSSWKRFPGAAECELDRLVKLFPTSKYPNLTFLKTKDWGPASKILPLVRYLKNKNRKEDHSKTNIVFVDDDREYDSDLLEKLEAASKDHPKDVITACTTFLSPYLEAQQACGRLGSRYVDTFVGCCGVLVKPEMFSQRAQSEIPSEFEWVDDVWLSGMFQIQNIKIWCMGRMDQKRTGNDNVEALCVTTERHKLNLACVSYFNKTYGIWKDLLEFLSETESKTRGTIKITGKEGKEGKGEAQDEKVKREGEGKTKSKQEQAETTDSVSSSSVPPKSQSQIELSQRAREKLKNEAGKVFDMIYTKKEWGDGYGSGLGAQIQYCWQYLVHLHNLLRRFEVKSVLDLGCGDWKFSQIMDWSGIHYLGIDCCEKLVTYNSLHYAKKCAKTNTDIQFITGDMFNQEFIDSIDFVPDLIIFKDVIAHWPNHAIAKYLPLWSSKARKVVAVVTDLSKLLEENWDIELGGYRPVNWTKDPLKNLGFQYHLTFESHHPKHIYLWFPPESTQKTKEHEGGT